MKYYLLIPVLAVAVGVPVFSRAEVADGVKAVVNDRAITFEEVELFTRPAVDASRSSTRRSTTASNNSSNAS
jgi:hypothetical protein